MPFSDKSLPQHVPQIRIWDRSFVLDVGGANHPVLNRKSQHVVDVIWVWINGDLEGQFGKCFFKLGKGVQATAEKVVISRLKGRVLYEWPELRIVVHHLFHGKRVSVEL